MKGTEKQIAYAKTCIEGAKAWYSSTTPQGVRIDRDGSQLAAIEVVEAVERGDLAAAGVALEKAASWIERALIQGDQPEIDAAAVIDALKKSYYCAKDKGLIA